MLRWAAAASGVRSGNLRWARARGRGGPDGAAELRLESELQSWRGATAATRAPRHSSQPRTAAAHDPHDRDSGPTGSSRPRRAPRRVWPSIGSGPVTHLCEPMSFTLAPRAEAGSRGSPPRQVVELLLSLGRATGFFLEGRAGPRCRALPECRPLGTRNTKTRVLKDQHRGVQSH